MAEQVDIAFCPEDEDLDHAWLCVCGNYETSGYCCSYCGCEPPWGCDCGAHDEEDEEDDWGWIGP
jgi:hypothetical protein